MLYTTYSLSQVTDQSYIMYLYSVANCPLMYSRWRRQRFIIHVCLPSHHKQGVKSDTWHKKKGAHSLCSFLLCHEWFAVLSYNSHTKLKISHFILVPSFHLWHCLLLKGQITGCAVDNMTGQAEWMLNILYYKSLEAVEVVVKVTWKILLKFYCNLLQVR